MAGSQQHQHHSSSTQLQAHYDEIMAQTPVLPLSMLPRALSSSLNAAAARLAKKAAAAVSECQACSCSSHPDQLQLLLDTRLEFHTRAVHATAVRFVCSQCAAAGSSALLNQLLAPAVGQQEQDAMGEDEEEDIRAEALQQLLLHFAAVNNAPASVTSNPDTLVLWVQEVACRAYSMGVVVNSLRGWQLQPAGASMPQVLQQLLKKQAKAAAAAEAAATPVAGGGGKRKKRSSSAAQAAAADAVTPATHSKKQKKAAAAAATPATAPSTKPHAATTPQQKQQQQQPGSTAKKQKHGAGTPPAVTPPATTAAAGAGAKKNKSASKQAAAAAAGMRTPQHAAVKNSSSKKQKLLKSAPR